MYAYLISCLRSVSKILPGQNIYSSPPPKKNQQQQPPPQKKNHVHVCLILNANVVPN